MRAMASSRAAPTAGYLYGFSVAHVQRYLLSTSRLREIQGGSQLLEELCGAVFGQAVEAAGLRPESILSRAAAGARLWSEDGAAVRRLYAIWPRMAEEAAPGAVIQQALVPLDESTGMAAAQRLLGERLRASRVDPLCALPAAGPRVERYPRTGEPAEERQRVGEEEEERVDRTTYRKVEAWRNLQQQGREGRSALDLRCLGALEGRYRFIRGRDPRAEGLTTEQNPYVGVIHADANAVGRVIDTLFAQTAVDPQRTGTFSRFSSALSAATQNAVEQAIEAVLVPAAVRAEDGSNERQTLRARPIVLGGDDLTFIVAAPLAFAFTEAFLAAFEETTREKLGALEIPGLGGLSACAGLALTKATFPFDRAHELAESLCSHAKALARAAAGTSMPSALAFHRVTSSLAEDVETVYERELSGPGTRLTFEAYRTGSGRSAGRSGLASFSDLRNLADHLRHLPRGGVRELLADLRSSPSRADTALSRILEVARSRPGKRPKVEPLGAALRRLTGGPNLLWTSAGADGLRRTPLLDAQTLLAAEKGSP